ncbi:MAG: hypothetical protein HYX34_07670 [Actinobacteria bacterium]|nr:hypothetical protein [Actinomycetota bacterium]
MIAVVARRGDDEAQLLVDRCQDLGAVLVTADDLGAPGWVAPLDGCAGRFVAEGRPRPTGDISLAVVRQSVVLPAELEHLVAGDRDYAAAEMTAFLAWWLTRLGDRVVNRPSPGWLLGPAWSRDHWMAVAHRAGIPTSPHEPAITGGDDLRSGALTEVTVVDGAAVTEEGAAPVRAAASSTSQRPAVPGIASTAGPAPTDPPTEPATGPSTQRTAGPAPTGMAAACRAHAERLARHAGGVRLLGAAFERSGAGEWQLVAVTLRPALTPAVTGALRRLARDRRS